MEVSLVVTLVASVLVLQSVVSGQSDSDVSVKWGVADSTATVGKLFRLHIPGDAFSGTVLSHTVTRSDGTPLPSWLEFDSKEALLQGIPTPADAGQLYLEVTAKGAGSQASVSSTIFVRDVPSHTSGSPLRFKTSGPEFVWCKQTEPETVATLIVDADLDTLPVSDRLDLLQKFLSHMNLHDGMIKMVPVGNSPLHDSSALVSGDGDGLVPKTCGLFISWPVGCGQVKESHFPVLHKLDDDSSSGRMAKVLGHSIIGWHVTNSHFQATPRKRRQVQATPTPALSPVMPTKTETKAEATGDRMTHTLIDVQSPSLIHPTATQPPITRTDEPIVPPPVPAGETSAKLMPTETTPAVTTTRETPPIIPTKTREPGEATDVPPVVSVDCEQGQKPKVKGQPLKLTYHVGDVIDYVVPDNIFEDCEVGGTRRLQLTLYTQEADVAFPEFLHFDSKQQKLVGLPLKDDVKLYEFRLVAKKTESLFASVELTLIVRDVRMKKKLNHELSVTIDYDYEKFMSNVSERVHLANRIAGVYGDADARYMVVTNIGQGSVIYGWTNNSLASSDCPADEVRALVRQLVNEDGSLTDAAVMKLKPFVLLSAESQPTGACVADARFPVVVGKAREAATTPEMTTSEDPAKGAAGGDDEDDVWITTVVPAVVIVVILFIALLVACILYRKKRKGKMNVEEQNTFINKGAPVIFPYELEDKPSDANKPLLVEGTQAPPPQYQRASSESPERPLAGNYRNLTATSAADDSITELPDKPYEPPPPVASSTNGKQTRPSHQQQQQPFTQPPQILP